jgi:hypothetical protein
MAKIGKTVPSGSVILREGGEHSVAVEEAQGSLGGSRVLVGAQYGGVESGAQQHGRAVGPAIGPLRELQLNALQTGEGFAKAGRSC